MDGIYSAQLNKILIRMNWSDDMNINIVMGFVYMNQTQFLCLGFHLLKRAWLSYLTLFYFLIQ